MNLLLKVLLIVSLFFNVALYFGWIDVGQYRDYVDQWIQSWRDIWNSEERKNLFNLVWEKFTQLYWSDVNVLLEDAKQKIKDYGTQKATEMLQEQYDKLDASDINTLVEQAKDELLEQEVINAEWTWDENSN